MAKIRNAITTAQQAWEENYYSVREQLLDINPRMKKEELERRTLGYLSGPKPKMAPREKVDHLKY